MMPHTIRHELACLVPVDCPALPWKRWSALAAVAVGGSLLYGASLTWVLPDWEPVRSALWFALAAGLAWGVFIPALYTFTSLRWRECCDASLATMAFGEVVLVSGALVNALLQWHAISSDPAFINGLIVALSNIVMATALARLLRPRGVPTGRTLLLWMLTLNGSGAASFLALHSIFHG